MSQNKKLYLMLLSRHDHFHPILNFACKDSQIIAGTCKYFCSLVLNPTITKLQRAPSQMFLDLSLKILPCTKTSLFSCKNQSFILLFQNVTTFIKSHCVFLCYFLQYGEVFLISLLDGCYHYLVFVDPVNRCSEPKLLVKD